MTVRVTVTWKSAVHGQEVVYEIATDVGYSPDVVDDMTARIRSEFCGAIASLKGVAIP